VVDPKGEHEGKNCQADEIKEDGVVHILLSRVSQRMSLLLQPLEHFQQKIHGPPPRQGRSGALNKPSMTPQWK
jgi:hypothetical protein